MNVCEKCEALGVTYRRTYAASEFLEGYSDSPIWIVGINPAEDPSWNDGRSLELLKTGFSGLSRQVPYFRNFSRVSSWLHSQIGQPQGVAHTDLVKCSSKSWPPPGCSGKAARDVVSNCSPFLVEQIMRFRPKLIVCNGSEVSTFIQSVLHPSEPLDGATSYRSTVGEAVVWVVLSGFIGRIDNFARARLGAEIERIATAIGVKTQQ